MEILLLSEVSLLLKCYPGNLYRFLVLVKGVLIFSLHRSAHECSVHCTVSVTLEKIIDRYGIIPIHQNFPFQLFT